jgi:uncharacterized Fe-S cluster-containing radical SAM superfamily protein
MRTNGDMAGRNGSLLSTRNLGQFLRGHIPGQVVIQLTDRCNAECPQCGMRASNRFRRSTLDRDVARRTLEACADRRVASVSFTGGEPFMCFDLMVELLEYGTDLGIPYLRTGTNGFFLRGAGEPDFEARITEIAERLAGTGLHNLWISLDSADPQTHEDMRGLSGVVEGMARALPIFHAHGIYPAANLGINRNIGGYDERLYRPGELEMEELYAHFLRAFRAFYNLVIDLGFTMSNACYPMSIRDGDGLEAVYQASAEDLVVSFTSPEKREIFRAFFASIQEFRDRIRIFSPLTAVRTLIDKYSGNDRSHPCLGGRDFFFVSAADGGVYPCGYRGKESLGTMWDLTLPDEGPSCRLCDWECFRDPSELVGPLLDLRFRPWKWIGQQIFGGETRDLWRDDVRYIRACDYFNGRKPPDTDRIEAASRTGPTVWSRS